VRRQALQGWLLLLPAALLLVTFTHYPTAATLYHSFFSTPKPSRPSVWVGLDNYRSMAEDPVFWQVLGNNTWYALATIPLSIVLAILMAIWVNGKIPGRGLLRLAFLGLPLGNAPVGATIVGSRRVDDQDFDRPVAPSVEKGPGGLLHRPALRSALSSYIRWSASRTRSSLVVASVG